MLVLVLLNENWQLAKQLEQLGRLYLQLVSQQAISSVRSQLYSYVTLLHAIANQLTCARSIKSIAIAIYYSQLQLLIAVAMHVFSSVLIGPLHVQASVTHHPRLEAILHSCQLAICHSYILTKLTCSTLHIQCGVIYDTVKYLSQCHILHQQCGVHSYFIVTVKQNYKST